MPNSRQQIALAERHFRSGQIERSEKILREVIARDDDAPQACELLAYICGNRGQLAECEALLQKASASPRCSPEALYYLGRVRLQSARAREAIGSFEASIRRAGEFFEALHELGVAHAALGEYERALHFYQRAGRKNPRSPELFSNTAASLVALKRSPEALQCYERALAIDPANAKTWASRAATLVELRRVPDALASYERALALTPADAPDNDCLHGDVLQTRMRLCRWENWSQFSDDVMARVHRGERAAEPFALLATPASAAVELACSRIHAAALYPSGPAATFEARDPERKIRVAYFSADFRQHATSQLMARLFEVHDRSRFEWFAYSFSGKRDEMSARVAAAFDRFVEVGDRSDAEVAAMAREAGIDIAVDLHGFTDGRRTGIFAARAAPVQVNYLGYPGSMGCEYIDYIIADETLVAPEDRIHYSEKVVTLPGCYQANDNTKRIGDAAASRESEGLPAQGFVFACFNNPHKITPDVFDIWMRLLQNVPGSVLWLYGATGEASSALIAEAQARGIAPDRLVWAQPRPLADHLARHAHADLFVDTFHYNAHTTCSDALWAGLPVLTLAGSTFASRVGASLLNAIGLPELVTRSVAEYEALAMALAASPGQLGDLRRRLQSNRSSEPLFDTELFARHIEAAFEAMWSRRQQGLAPDHIRIADRKAR